MNPILWMGILLAGFFLWLICSSLYKPIGKFFGTLMNDAKEKITETDRENIENE